MSGKPAARQGDMTQYGLARIHIGRCRRCGECSSQAAEDHIQSEQYIGTTARTESHMTTTAL
ncbi:hypothetical protein, partial [Escherichia coli]|uniref:hypothetical protein n=1 Tax=Escherichia coli TaxID=562 RepID=UPI001BC83507